MNCGFNPAPIVRFVFILLVIFFCFGMYFYHHSIMPQLPEDDQSPSPAIPQVDGGNTRVTSKPGANSMVDPEMYNTPASMDDQQQFADLGEIWYTFLVILIVGGFLVFVLLLLLIRRGMRETELRLVTEQRKLLELQLCMKDRSRQQPDWDE